MSAGTTTDIEKPTELRPVGVERFVQRVFRFLWSLLLGLIKSPYGLFLGMVPTIYFGAYVTDLKWWAFVLPMVTLRIIEDAIWRTWR